MALPSAIAATVDVGSQPWRHRHIIHALAARELSARFRGSLFGGLWAVLQPIAVVLIFYYVLVVIFQARWAPDSTSGGDFIVGMFLGLLAFNLLAETVGRSTGVITANVNYVKKIVFPITVLPIVQLAYACVNWGIGILVLIVFGLAWGLVTPTLSWLALPLCMVPVILWAIGLGWLTSALNVYFRDTAVVVPLLLQTTMFLSPVFYNLDRIPPQMQQALKWSPLAMPITETRQIVMQAAVFNPWNLLLPTLTGTLVLVLGYLFFRRVKPGFADVL